MNIKPLRKTIANGFREEAKIYAEYECGRISFEEAFERLKNLFDAKGDTTPFMTAVRVMRDWER